MAIGLGMDLADRTHSEVAPGYPHPQQLVGLDVSAIHDHPAVAVLHDCVPPFEGGQR